MINPCLFDVEFEIQNVNFDIAVEGLQIVTIGELPMYDGVYTVDPLAKSATVLPTKGKNMTDNITVNKIRQLEVSNTAGGNTLIIGEDL